MVDHPVIPLIFKINDFQNKIKQLEKFTGK
jgi:hypothetical protein